MYLERLKKLPPDVRNVIFGPDDESINDYFFARHTLSDEQLFAINAIYLEIVLGDKQVLNLLDYVSKLPQSKGLDLRQLALDIALRKLWPLQEYLGNVNTLINRLGGIAPPMQSLHDVVKKNADDNSYRGTARDILSKYKYFGALLLTQKPLTNEMDKIIAPSVEHWLKDYLHVMGAEASSSLKRTQYLVKSPNANALNDAEKTNLLNFLLSYDDDIEMYWYIEGDEYLLVEPESKEKKESTEHEQSENFDIEQMLRFYDATQIEYQKLFQEKKKGLAVEIGGNTKKLDAIVWDALGLNELDRFLAACNMLIDNHMFHDMLKTDKRFKGIVARAIDMKYGIEAKRFWNADLSSVSSQIIFWHLVLVEKLHMPEDKAAILAEYFTQKMGLKQRIAYLDMSDGKFKFRSIVYDHRQFILA